MTLSSWVKGLWSSDKSSIAPKSVYCAKMANVSSKGKDSKEKETAEVKCAALNYGNNLSAKQPFSTGVKDCNRDMEDAQHWQHAPMLQHKEQKISMAHGL